MFAVPSNHDFFEQKKTIFSNELYFSDVSSDEDSDSDSVLESNNKLPNKEADTTGETKTCLHNNDHDHDKDDHHHETQVISSLQDTWNYYYHLPNDKNWNLDSYCFIAEGIDGLEPLIGINEMVTDNIIKNCMLFVMKKGVTPMWEDTHNRNGGCFSYKVVNKVICQVWRKLVYLLCGNSLTVDAKHGEMVNGITISPKKGFCILKIWMKTCKYQDPSIIVNVDGLSKNGCLFKAHSPEF